ncbi:MAG: DUF99 family protein [Candidatus Thorarchaeota archaeon]|nr:DUF99 family protein [Candidatus Thorarchaeota archaeon]
MGSVHKIQQTSLDPKPFQWKAGIRVLGVAESFSRGDRTSYVAGVVMRGDLKIDGFCFCNPAVGGIDSTEQFIRMYHNLKRTDIRTWLLGGSIISWFNTLDIHKIHQETETPVVSISYTPSEGLEKYVREYFPSEWEKRMAAIDSIGTRKEVMLNNGLKVFIVSAGIEEAAAVGIVNHFTHNGRIPEPVRVARQLAASIRVYQKTIDSMKEEHSE